MHSFLAIYIEFPSTGNTNCGTMKKCNVFPFTVRATVFKTMNALVISQKTVIYFWTALNSLISWGTTHVYYLHFLKQDKRLAKHSNVNSWVWSSASIDASLAWQAIVISDDLLSAHEMLLQTLTRMPNYQNLSNQLPIPRGISPFLGFKMSKN